MKLTPKQQREYEQNQKAMREAAQQLRMEQGSLKSPSMVTSLDGLGTRTELTTEQQREYEQNQVAQQKAREELLKHGSYKSMTSTSPKKRGKLSMGYPPEVLDPKLTADQKSDKAFEWIMGRKPQQKPPTK